ncbi:hypothetical protein VTN96DRAFT_4109 [Rasamsonia emersonii]|uniref:Uncharacterized protein n=1 Tax=Rasamsonia emersonii (strain ATCC 16479 / CBS 393.64 / IMI 116815) TaxID=1408163 RepID=A0A0F4YVW8_RASE3|nr:hypothetical protein T310_3725 [Rasamsonia emersonii CBS 393.64]KKA22230.1 hypothetical protein T310_3725 [Rasamsonia emersonii CBS 393.64]
MPTTTTTTTSTADASTLSPAALESNLFNHLASTSALEDLHDNLLCALQRAGWTERVRNLSLELLRAGRCDRFDDVVDAVVALAEGRTHPAVTPEDNGEARDPETDAFFENIDVRIPSSVVEQGVKAIKEALRPIVTIEDDGDATDGDGEQEQSQPQPEDSTPTKKEEPADGKQPEKGKAGKDIGGGGHRKSIDNGNSTSAPRPPLKNGDASPSKKPAAKDKKPKTGGKDVKTSS